MSTEESTSADQADVYKQGVLAAQLVRHKGGTRFSYLPEYLNLGQAPIASSLPLSAEPVVTGSGSVPPFFTGLLPEGRRLSSLRRAVKASADDELALLVAVGGDPVGDVQIVARGTNPVDVGPAVVLDPKSPVNFQDLLAETGVDPRAIAGVQDKVSAGMVSVPVEAAGRAFILKLDPPEYPHVVENEFLMYSYARRLKLPLSRVQIIRDSTGQPGLLVERFDRVSDDDGGLRRLAVEDASQVMGLYPADKYDVAYEVLCRNLTELSSAPLPALRNLSLQVVFAWLTGNGDLHAKNVSILQDARGRVAVAPIYDIPSTVVYGDNSLALAVAGKRTGLSRKHFLGWMQDAGLRERAAEGVIITALSATRTLVDDLANGASPFSDQLTRNWVKALKNRRRLMEPN